jgi:ATP-dependent DNA ligase
LDCGYENKRSWSLVKVKLFEDTEFEVVDLELDAMGRLGRFIMKAPEGLTDRDGKAILTFKAGITGISHEEGLQVIANKADYIGKQGTVEYFGVSEYGIPRFPKFKGIRNDA